MPLKLYACLPFVELPKSEGISFGPVHFWPSSDASLHLPASFQPLFNRYLETISVIKADREIPPITTGKLPSRVIGCVSIEENIDEEVKESLLIDALYLLYFAASFRNVYYDSEITKIQSFTKIIPASETFIAASKNWEKAYIAEAKREEIACINWIDPEICNALGRELTLCYTRGSDPKLKDEAIRLIRAVRFFVDRFFNKFENLFSQGIAFHPKLFEAEDTLFLASSFDVLLDISDQFPASDFRQKIRPMLHLKFSKPIELFWKWVDAFYLLKKQVIHGMPLPQDIFTDNSNFRIPLLNIGIKLFIYTIYYRLFQNHLIQGCADRFTPPDFKWIHPQEILLFFWTEESILRKISILLMQIHSGRTTPENQSDVKLLSSLFIALMDRFYRKTNHPFAAFIPTDNSILEPYVNPIRDYALISHEYISPEFLEWLKVRIQ